MYDSDTIFDILAPVREFVLSQIRDNDVVVDLGPGQTPLERANICADNIQWKDQRPYQIVDFHNDKLPDGDFYYCRHVLEDLRYPENVLRQLQGKRGYIETPSPLQECLAGVYRNIPVHGHIHHYWYIWEDTGVLYFLPKYPIVSRIHVDPRALLRFDFFWNTYFTFEGDFKYKIFSPNLHFKLDETFTGYFELLEIAVMRSIESIKGFAERIGAKDITGIVTE